MTEDTVVEIVAVVDNAIGSSMLMTLMLMLMPMLMMMDLNLYSH
jgi:hypothetical protein